MCQCLCECGHEVCISCTVMPCCFDVLCLSPGAEHDPVYPESGPADPEGPAVRPEDGGPTQRPGDQVQTGGGEPQAELRQTIQGTVAHFTATLLYIYNILSCVLLNIMNYH